MNIVQALIEGGGTRLLLDPVTHANRYQCTPLPESDVLSFSSCSARTISPWALQTLEQELQEISPSRLKTKMEALRCSIAAILEINTMGAEIILSPSGTDSTLHALFLMHTFINRSLDSIVIAPDETGSAILDVASGLHFDSQTAHGLQVEKGQPLAHWDHETRLLTVPVRDTLGNDYSPEEIDQSVFEAVAHSVQSNRQVLLHAIDGSKLGRTYPSPACLEEIRNCYGEDVQILLDCCQGRISRSEIKSHLARGALLTFTGSKFYTGPTFSGALLVPPEIVAKAKTITTIPKGMQDYTETSVWPSDWVGIRSMLPDTINMGLYARWFAALLQMQAYYSIPTDFRKSTLRDLTDALFPILKDCPYLQLLSLPQNQEQTEIPLPTIFPFFLRHQGALLSFTSVMKVYNALNQDFSACLSDDASKQDKDTASQRFQVGYPVCIGDLGVLRVCIDARMVYEAWSKQSNGDLQSKLKQIQTFTDKLALILRYSTVI